MNSYYYIFPDKEIAEYENSEEPATKKDIAKLMRRMNEYYERLSKHLKEHDKAIAKFPNLLGDVEDQIRDTNREVDRNHRNIDSAYHQWRSEIHPYSYS